MSPQVTGAVAPIVLTTLNFTDHELVLDHVVHDRGSFATPPPTTIPARATVAFSVRPDARAGAEGHVDWRGIDPERGEFHFQVAWEAPAAGPVTAAARHFHRLPCAGRGECPATGTPVATRFLHTAAIDGSRRSGAELVFELHPRRTATPPPSAWARATGVAR